MKAWRILVLLAVVAALVAAGAAWHYNNYLETPVSLAEGELDFVIEQGSSFTRVSEHLAKLGVITNPGYFRLHARLTDQAGSVQAGEYLIEDGVTPAALLTQFTDGSVKLYAFTLIEGWNHWELLDALTAHPNLDVSLTSEDWPAFLQQLGAEGTYPEGLFLPETYHFPNGTTGRGVLTEAFDAMQRTLAEEWENRSQDAVVKTPYEALVLASIIEKETARADERQRISGVFTRRLNKRMRLQTDPTVIYGLMPGFNGNLTRKNLRSDTPYNTYTRGGLPPTPIAMPGRAAIHAALQPADGTEVYFVATGLGDGSHKFSETKEQHDAAVREYLKRLRSQ